MESKLYLDIYPQPDGTTCGPTCLHAVYRFFNDPIPLPQVVSEVKQLEEGGTLAVYLGSHALARGYKATIYTSTLPPASICLISCADSDVRVGVNWCHNS